MIKKIINPAYNYLGDDVISYSATVNLIAEDGVTIIASLPVSVVQNQAEPLWAELMALAVKAQVDDYIAKFQEVFARGVSRFPAAATIEGIVAEFTAFVETEVNT